MSYVLTVIHPPTDGAAYGKAEVSEPLIHWQHAADLAGDTLIGHRVLTMSARTFANRHLWDGSRTGPVKHEPTGLTFRIDPITNAPHPCSCCRRIVLPADLEGALCAGCYTFDNTEQCLPENTAHPTEES